jgi:hypothetical protein
MSRIRVSIGKLVLNGFEPADRAALVEGLRGELTRVLADPATRGEWARSRRTPVLRLGQMSFEPGRAGGRKFGQRMARDLVSRMKP